MRPLPIEPAASMPDFVLGLSMIRGEPVPVVDAAVLLGGAAGGEITRFIVLRVAQRRVALAVARVVGLRELAQDSLHALPPLLAAALAETVAAIGTLDAALLPVLHTARLLTAFPAFMEPGA